MKIVVLSDTHMPKKAKQLPPQLMEDIKTADLAIHAGDWQTLDVYKELSAHVKVEGVAGNVDGEEMKQLFPKKLILSIGKFEIGIVHGHGQGRTTEKRAMDSFAYEEVDCIIFGHSHIPILKEQEDILLFNPGSPTDKRRQKQYSYGLLYVGNELIAEHVFFDRI